MWHTVHWEGASGAARGIYMCEDKQKQRSTRLERVSLD
jgi:hypothetical protein